MAQKPRTVHPDDAQDERLAQVPLTAAYTYVYLPTVLDDEGRMKDQPAVLNGYLWPLRADEHPTSAMAADLQALVDAGLMCRYTIEGKSYLHDPAWRSRQRPARPEPSDLPPCPTHETPFEDAMAETFSRLSEQVNHFFGAAASRVDQARFRDTVARLVEDVTFPVDPEKATEYGRKVREFLGGAAEPADEPPAATWPGGDAGPDRVDAADEAEWSEVTDDPRGRD